MTKRNRRSSSRPERKINSHSGELQALSPRVAQTSLFIILLLNILQATTYYYIQEYYPEAFNQMPLLLQNILVIAAVSVHLLSLFACFLLWATGGKINDFMLRGFLWIPSLNLTLILIPLLFALGVPESITTFVSSQLSSVDPAIIRNITTSTLTIASWSISGPIGNAAYDFIKAIANKKKQS